MLVVGAAIVREGKCLVAKRGSAGSAAGKWEFPGGKVEAGEAPEAALVREIAEELGVEISVGAHLGRGTAGDIVLDVFVAELLDGEPVCHEHSELSWIGAGEVHALDWAPPDVPVLPSLVRLLGA